MSRRSAIFDEPYVSVEIIPSASFGDDLLMTRDELLLILDGGDFAPLIGVREDLEIEFKGQPYQLDSENQKFELAARQRVRRALESPDRE